MDISVGKGLIAIGDGLAVLTGFSTGLGEGNVAAHAVEAIGKNPEAEAKIRSTMSRPRTACSRIRAKTSSCVLMLYRTSFSSSK